MLNRLFPDDIDVAEMFAGGGGSGTGIAAVPGTKLKFAANHAKPAKWTYVQNHPDVDFWLGDVQAADAIEKFPYASFFWASPACFVAGTLILTRRGLVPIEEVREGDEVFTHQRRWRLVTGTMSKLAPTVIVSGKGFHQGVETTAEHPFYTRKRTRTWDNDARTYRYSVADESEWTEAKDLGAGTWWATPTDFGDALPVPEVGGRGMKFTPEFWWMVGRWVGDGWRPVDGGERVADDVGGGTWSAFATSATRSRWSPRTTWSSAPTGIGTTSTQRQQGRRPRALHADQPCSSAGQPAGSCRRRPP